MLYKTLAALLLSASFANSEALPFAPGDCQQHALVQDPSGALPEPRAFSLEESGLCAEYAWHGWEQPMYLHLGEGAADYYQLVQQAVALWNNVLAGFNRRNVITIITGRAPRAYSLPDDFWSVPVSASGDLIRDDQSVIYFKGGGDPEDVISFARTRADGLGAMVESDIYINTTHEDLFGQDLAYTHLVLDMTETTGVHAYVNSTYVTILHEIGHALGLNHVPVSGNIMSYKYMPRMVDIWRAPFVGIVLSSGMFLGRLPDTSNFIVQRKADVTPYMVLPEDLELLGQLFTSTVSLGEQDKMALMCIYDFEDWNH